MKFSGKMCLMIILKVTKKQSFTISLEDTFFEKPRGGWGWGVKLTPIPPAILGLRISLIICFCMSLAKMIRKVNMHATRSQFVGQVF